MNFTKTLFVLAIGSASIMGAMSAHALTLNAGDTLHIDAGVNAYDSNGNFTNVSSGSWFAMDTNGDSKIAGTEKMAVSQGITGLVIGVTTSPGDILAPREYFGSIGSEYVTKPVTGSTEAGLDFSGWTLTWTGIPDIDMGGGAWGTGYSDGVANFSGSWYWSGNEFDMPFIAYTLDYHATVPLGDPSGMGGVKYVLHLEALPVPEASTYGMLLVGLGLVGFAVRRRSWSGGRHGLTGRVRSVGHAGSDLQ